MTETFEAPPPFVSYALPDGEAWMVKNAGHLVPKSGSPVSPAFAMAQFLDTSLEKATAFIASPQCAEMGLEVVKVRLTEVSDSRLKGDNDE